MKIGFIGAGRAGTGLAMEFVRAGHDVAAVASRSPEAAQALARRLPTCQVMSPQDIANAAELVFLTVSDDAIEMVASQIKWRAGSAVVHCSGAADLDVLAKAEREGALAGGFHPLRMFGRPEESSGTLRGCAIALAGPPSLLAMLEPLVRTIGARPLRLPDGSRAMYHAAANFSGAFIIALIEETVALWRQIGISTDDALAALLPLLRGTVDSVEAIGAAGALGSAIARGDVGTIRKHLDALAKSPRSLELYCLLSRRTLPLALAKGTLDAKTAAEIEATLSSAERRFRD